MKTAAFIFICLCFSSNLTDTLEGSKQKQTTDQDQSEDFAADLTIDRSSLMVEKTRVFALTRSANLVWESTDGIVAQMFE